jgi:antitoxin (DNA-binding transcriptional repressor) of toxin-antitoxin stability system
MRSVSVQEAKTHLSRLLRAVERGEEIEIRRGRTPVALLSQRRPATTSFADLRDRFANEVEIADDFDELDEETARGFGVID